MDPKKATSDRSFDFHLVHGQILPVSCVKAQHYQNDLRETESAVPKVRIGQWQVCTLFLDFASSAELNLLEVCKTLITRHCPTG